jgi:hypothetical protein
VDLVAELVQDDVRILGVVDAALAESHLVARMVGGERVVNAVLVDAHPLPVGVHLGERPSIEAEAAKVELRGSDPVVGHHLLEPIVMPGVVERAVGRHEGRITGRRHHHRPPAPQISGTVQFNQRDADALAVEDGRVCVLVVLQGGNAAAGDGVGVEHLAADVVARRGRLLGQRADRPEGGGGGQQQGESKTRGASTGHERASSGIYEWSPGSRRQTVRPCHRSVNARGAVTQRVAPSQARRFRSFANGPAQRILAAHREEKRVARDEKLDLLHRIPLFSGFDRRRLERLGQLADEVDVPAEKVLMRQGENGTDMMVIVSGRVAVERDGERLNTLGAGDFFGEIALLDGGPRTATVTSEEPTRLLVLTHREFHALMDEFPEVAAQVLNALAHRIRRLEPDTAH